MRPRPWSPVVNVIGLVCLVVPALCVTGLVAWWARGLSSFAMSARRDGFSRYRRARKDESGWKPSRKGAACRHVRRWK